MGAESSESAEEESIARRVAENHSTPYFDFSTDRLYPKMAGASSGR
jgi:hypothetical protein